MPPPPRRLVSAIYGTGRPAPGALSCAGVPRSSLFIQTKFTSVRGQDPNNVPYDPHLPLPEQVSKGGGGWTVGSRPGIEVVVLNPIQAVWELSKSFLPRFLCIFS